MQSTSATQLILFGSPGTGKSHLVKTKILPSIGVVPSSDNCISTVFHPEYSYGDFMGKLLPLSTGGRVEYRYYAGHFLRALARAYRNLLVKEQESPEAVALVIDEINRGNSAAIFGTVFQLLDRYSDGWSTYDIDISDMEFDTLLTQMGVEIDQSYDASGKVRDKTYRFLGKTYFDKNVGDLLAPLGLRRNQIKIPSNMSLIATMNTSDNSIYYMDTAFKRRWEWQYINNNSSMSSVEGTAFTSRPEWDVFVAKINAFIRSNHASVRKVEDKQIGNWFVVGDTITKSQIQNKVMFYLWDSVFSSSKRPLVELLQTNSETLVTFGDFASQVDAFINALSKRQ